jgi:hypothetical protein
VTRIVICHSMVHKALLQGLQHLTGHRLCVVSYMLPVATSVLKLG